MRQGGLCLAFGHTWTSAYALLSPVLHATREYYEGLRPRALYDLAVCEDPMVPLNAFPLLYQPWLIQKPPVSKPLPPGIIFLGLYRIISHFHKINLNIAMVWRRLHTSGLLQELKTSVCLSRNPKEGQSHPEQAEHLQLVVKCLTLFRVLTWSIRLIGPDLKATCTFPDKALKKMKWNICCHHATFSHLSSSNHIQQRVCTEEYSILNNLTKIVELQKTLWREGQNLWSTYMSSWFKWLLLHPVTPPEVKAQCAHQTTQMMPAQNPKTRVFFHGSNEYFAWNN